MELLHPVTDTWKLKAAVGHDPAELTNVTAAVQVCAAVCCASDREHAEINMIDTAIAALGSVRIQEWFERINVFSLPMS